MKLQLPADTFPTLELSREDMDNMESVASMLVDAAVDEYAAFRRASRAGVADRARWKPLKHRDGISVYHERVATTPTIRSTARRTTTASRPHSDSDCIQSLLAVGCVPGTTRDALLGMLNATREQAHFKTACTGDGVADSLVLASIVQPSPTNPQRQLIVKWSATGARGSTAAALAHPLNPIKARDAVFIESTGMALSETGEQIAYCLIHSVEIPGIRKLREHNLVRANVSVCCLFRQKQPGVLEMFVKGCFDPRGSVRPSMTLSHAANALLSFRHIVHCAQMKKLVWMVATGSGDIKSADVGDLTMATRTSLLSTLTSSYHDRTSSGTETNPAKGVLSSATTSCSSCQGRLRGNSPIPHRRRVCDVCDNAICSVCVVPSHVSKRAFFRAVAARRTPNMSSSSGAEESSTLFGRNDDRLVVCRCCFRVAERTDALDVALEDTRLAMVSSSGFDSALMASATSLFSLINSDRYDSTDCFFFNVH